MRARLVEGLLCVFVGLLWAGVAPMHAQVAAGEITGHVKDSVRRGGAWGHGDRHRRRHEPGARRRLDRRRRLHGAKPRVG